MEMDSEGTKAVQTPSRAKLVSDCKLNYLLILSQGSQQEWKSLAKLSREFHERTTQLKWTILEYVEVPEVKRLRRGLRQERRLQYISRILPSCLFLYLQFVSRVIIIVRTPVGFGANRFMRHQPILNHQSDTLSLDMRNSTWDMRE